MNETEATASASSNEDSDEDASVNVDADEVEESPRKRKPFSSIIDEVTIKYVQDLTNVSNQKDDDQKRLELSKLTPAEMSCHIRQLEAELFELSKLEARELSRSAHLRIFGNARKRASK
ncbi:GH21926 [Drosophila grimshawi]|uniref:GH21926 n=2 Tax=Drosophila grimshawi TaxID=7222 RepID=B4J8G2_DROGR|nr:GH21926 [Drosophila grimshawi]